QVWNVGSGKGGDNGLPLGRAGRLTDLLEAGVVALRRSGVELTRTADLEGIADHLVPVGDPARGAAGGEDHGEQVHRDADGFQDDARVEVDIRVEVALDEVFVLESNLFQLYGDL